MRIRTVSTAEMGILLMILYWPNGGKSWCCGTPNVVRYGVLKIKSVPPWWRNEVPIHFRMSVNRWKTQDLFHFWWYCSWPYSQWPFHLWYCFHVLNSFLYYYWTWIVLLLGICYVMYCIVLAVILILLISWKLSLATLTPSWLFDGRMFTMYYLTRLDK